MVFIDLKNINKNRNKNKEMVWWALNKFKDHPIVADAAGNNKQMEDFVKAKQSRW